jgi:chorismate mutase/prephenate dehydrogenase
MELRIFMAQQTPVSANLTDAVKSTSSPAITATSQITSDTAGAVLSGHRAQIDEIDSELVALLARRAAVTKQIGAIKQQYQLPLYVPAREQALLNARRTQALQLGVDGDLVEDVLRRIMRDSYKSQNQAFTRCLHSSTQADEVIVIGGAGALGRVFVDYFQRSHYQVRVVEQADMPYQSSWFAQAKLVLIAVPIDVTAAVIQAIPELPADCVLADITSIKHTPMTSMLSKHAGPVLGLHPMFGPDVPALVKQVVICCHGRDAEHYHWLTQQLQQWGAVLRFVEASNHDAAMQLIQAMRHFSSLVYGVHLAEEQADLAELLALSSPIYRLELAMVGRLFAQNAELYADIMLASADASLLLQRYLQRFNRLSHLLAAKDKAGLVAEFAKGQHYFGDYAQQFLQESRQLLQKAADGRV